MSGRKRPARFEILALLDDASRFQRGTVTITPSGIFSVRPHRRRRAYELNLSQVASLVVRQIIRAEVAAKAKAKKAKRGLLRNAS